MIKRVWVKVKRKRKKVKSGVISIST